MFSEKQSRRFTLPECEDRGDDEKMIAEDAFKSRHLKRSNFEVIAMCCWRYGKRRMACDRGDVCVILVYISS